ncbi:MAG: glutamyl-tRNA reductase [Gammaproteobacteria bacterium]|nr:MAG: glutamyl-tRNA reductase [Gammaproteobacteria bacterium]
MTLLTLGINYKTAPVDIRERVAFSPAQLPEALKALAARSPVKEAAILSTCNRMELYCGMERPDQGIILEWLKGYHRLDPRIIQPYLYTYPEQRAVRHLMRVASGLDSMVLGEPQVLGQVKTAYRLAKKAGTVGRLLGRLFQHTFAVAKQVRTDTAIGESAVSVAFAAVTLAKQIFGVLEGNTALLIGAGETIELAARHLYQNRIGKIIVANRTVERAHALASQFGGYAIALQEIPFHLEEADIVITSTASPLPILGKGAVERALKARKRRPMFMVDIAVPRDIEPEVDHLEDVYLYTVDDLEEVIQENLLSRREAAEQAEEIIDHQVARFMAWLRSLEAVKGIRQYRGQAERMRDEALRKARRSLAAGADPEEVVEYLAYQLTNKLLHRPCVQMRRAAEEGRADLLAAAQELLGFEHEET